jgi:hypothetical protein
VLRVNYEQLLRDLALVLASAPHVGYCTWYVALR